MVHHARRESRGDAGAPRRGAVPESARTVPVGAVALDAEASSPPAPPPAACHSAGACRAPARCRRRTGVPRCGFSSPPATASSSSASRRAHIAGARGLTRETCADAARMSSAARLHSGGSRRSCPRADASPRSLQHDRHVAREDPARRRERHLYAAAESEVAPLPAVRRRAASHALADADPASRPYAAVGPRAEIRTNDTFRRSCAPSPYHTLGTAAATIHGRVPRLLADRRRRLPAAVPDGAPGGRAVARQYCVVRDLAERHLRRPPSDARRARRMPTTRRGGLLVPPRRGLDVRCSCLLPPRAADCGRWRPRLQEGWRLARAGGWRGRRPSSCPPPGYAGPPWRAAAAVPLAGVDRPHGLCFPSVADFVADLLANGVWSSVLTSPHAQSARSTPWPRRRSRRAPPSYLIN